MKILSRHKVKMLTILIALLVVLLVSIMSPDYTETVARGLSMLIGLI